MDGSVCVEHLVDRAARDRPEHPALVENGRRWTYAQLRAEMDRRAALLGEAGVQRGAVVATTEAVTADVALAFLACCRAGAVFLHLSPKLTVLEIGPLIGRADPRLILTGDGAPHPAAIAIAALPVSLPGRPAPPALAAIRDCGADGAADDLVALESTSRTTSREPKFVAVPHRRLTARAMAPLWWELPDDVVYIPQPNAFTLAGFCGALAQGQTLVLSDALDPDRIEAELVQYGVTILRAVPTVVQPLVARDRPPPPDHRLRVVRTGTAALPVTAQHGLVARYGVAVVQEYGSNESGLVIGTPRGGAPEGSIGTPYPGVAVRIVDEGGADIADGAVGELIVRSPGLMRGYHDDPAATARVLRDGWLWTGDFARRDAAGFLYLEGRRALRISVGGFKVAPEEVEAVLATHPRVREVVVVGQPDAARGEVVRAIIVPQGNPPTVAELRRHCRGRLAGYKVPRRWEFRDTLPRSPLGKILRQHLARE